MITSTLYPPCKANTGSPELPTDNRRESMQYQAPANDLRFLLFDVLGADKLHELEKYADATPDLISAVIDEAGKLAAEVIQPTNQVGDRQGCSYDPETKLVKTRTASRPLTTNSWKVAGPHW